MHISCDMMYKRSEGSCPCISIYIIYNENVFHFRKDDNIRMFMIQGIQPLELPVSFLMVRQQDEIRGAYPWQGLQLCVSLKWLGL